MKLGRDLRETQELGNFKFGTKWKNKMTFRAAVYFQASKYPATTIQCGHFACVTDRLPILRTYMTWKSQSSLILSASIKLALGEWGRQVSRRASEISPWGLRKEESQNVLDHLIFLACESQAKLISAEGDIWFVKFLKFWQTKSAWMWRWYRDVSWGHLTCTKSTSPTQLYWERRDTTFPWETTLVIPLSRPRLRGEHESRQEPALPLVGLSTNCFIRGSTAEKWGLSWTYWDRQRASPHCGAHL